MEAENSSKTLFFSYGSTLTYMQSYCYQSGGGVFGSLGGGLNMKFCLVRGNRMPNGKGLARSQGTTCENGAHCSSIYESLNSFHGGKSNFMPVLLLPWKYMYSNDYFHGILFASIRVNFTSTKVNFSSTDIYMSAVNINKYRIAWEIADGRTQARHKLKSTP